MPVLSDLDHAHCERLLRGGTFGRIVVVTPHGAEIVPVNYAVDADTIVVRTASDGLLARHGDGAELVFEIDFVDHERWQGWSVVARGTGAVVHDLPNAGSGGPRIRPWPDGDHGSELRLTWTGLSGRQVGWAVPDAADARTHRTAP